MNLAALMAQARAVATRMDTRINAALTGNRELTAEEEGANTADTEELTAAYAQIDEQVAAITAAVTALEGVTAIAIVGAGNVAELQALFAAAGADDIVLSVAEASDADAERARVLGLIDLCPASAVSEPLRTAIEGGEGAGAFAIALAKDAKSRGASLADLKRGAVAPDQLPHGGKKAEPAKAGTVARGREIVARVAALGHGAVAHLKPAG